MRAAAENRRRRDVARMMEAYSPDELRQQLRHARAQREARPEARRYWQRRMERLAAALVISEGRAR